MTEQMILIIALIIGLIAVSIAIGYSHGRASKAIVKCMVPSTFGIQDCIKIISESSKLQKIIEEITEDAKQHTDKPLLEYLDNYHITNLDKLALVVTLICMIMTDSTPDNLSEEGE